MKNIVIALSILLIFSGCGKPDDTTERKIAVETSYILMSRGNCQGAIDILNSAPSSNTDGKFLQAKSLAYACRAGYSTVQLFGADIDEFATAASFINGFVNFSTSSLRVEVDDNNFNDLQEAIDILLYAGGIKTTQQPTSARRSQYFSTAALGEIDAQLTYMIMVQLGMYFRYYGNVDATGVKGSGGALSKCLLTYETGDATAIITAGPAGSCNIGDNIGHVDLMNGAAVEVERACRGIVLFNQLFDVFTGVINAAGSDLLGGGWTTDIQAAKGLAAVAGLSLLDEMSYDDCVADATATNDDEIEVYFAGIFEQAFL